MAGNIKLFAAFNLVQSLNNALKANSPVNSVLPIKLSPYTNDIIFPITLNVPVDSKFVVQSDVAIDSLVPLINSFSSLLIVPKIIPSTVDVFSCHVCPLSIDTEIVLNLGP